MNEIHHKANKKKTTTMNAKTKKKTTAQTTAVRNFYNPHYVKVDEHRLLVQFRMDCNRLGFVA